MVKITIIIKEAYNPNSLVYSKRRRTEIEISDNGMAHTRNGVHELGKGWLFIWSMNVLKSRNLLMLAYRNSSISKAQTHSSVTCFLDIVQEQFKQFNNSRAIKV
jgi:hypothetical protein